MADITRTYDYDGAAANGANLEADLDAIIARLNALEASCFQDATIEPEKLTNRGNAVYIQGKWMDDFVISGGQVPTGASLTQQATAIKAIVEGDLIEKVATNVVFTDEKDNYLDFEHTGEGTGSYQVTAVNHDAAAPAVYANSVRCQKVVTIGGEVTSVSDMRQLIPVSPIETLKRFRHGLSVQYKSATQITVTQGSCVVPKDDDSDFKLARLLADTDYSWQDYRDGSAVAADKFYYCYAIPQTDGLSFDLIVSDNAPADGPDGEDYYLFIGSFRTQAAATDIFDFDRGSDPFLCTYNGYFNVLDGGSDAAFAEVDCVTPKYVPATAKKAVIHGSVKFLEPAAGATERYIYFRRNGSSGDGIRHRVRLAENGTTGGFAHFPFTVTVPVDSSGIFEYYVDDNTDLSDVDLEVVGYYE